MPDYHRKAKMSKNLSCMKEQKAQKNKNNKVVYNDFL